MGVVHLRWQPHIADFGRAVSRQKHVAALQVQVNYPAKHVKACYCSWLVIWWLGACLDSAPDRPCRQAHTHAGLGALELWKSDIAFYMIKNLPRLCASSGTSLDGLLVLAFFHPAGGHRCLMVIFVLADIHFCIDILLAVTAGKQGHLQKSFRWSLPNTVPLDRLARCKRAYGCCGISVVFTWFLDANIAGCTLNRLHRD